MNTLTIIGKIVMTIILFYVIALFNAAGVMISHDVDKISSTIMIVIITLGGDLTLIWAIISIWRYGYED